MPPALSLHHVVRRYRAGIPGCAASIEVLRDVSLEVHAGEIVGLSGAGGSGKSTLLLCCAGRLRPDGGTISWFGAVSRSGLHPAGIALVPEHASYYSFLTVCEAIEYYCVLRDAPRAAGVRAGRALECVGLDGRTQRRVSQLSLGELRRLSLAQALVTSPRLLLLDETLDPPECDDNLGDLIRSLAADGLAILVATRDVECSVATRRLELVSGVVRPVPLVQEPSHLLELEVVAPAAALRRLAERFGAVVESGGCVRVPLSDVSAEEVMALCIALGVAVRSSTILQSRIGARTAHFGGATRSVRVAEASA